MIKRRKLKNLKKVIDELNAPVLIPDIEEEETQEKKSFLEVPSQFAFVLDSDNTIYDANEEYTINYEEDLRYLYADLAYEFGGFSILEVYDSIKPKLEEGLKKDLGPDAYLEWESNTRLIICSPRNNGG